MQTTRQLRCEQCGHESDPQYRFCGMCGSRLPAAPNVSTGRHGKARAEEDSAPSPVSGPSFLGLADEPTDRVAYLLEDEPDGSRGARLFVIILLLVGVAFAGWHWRSPLREWAMRAMQRPVSTQPNPQPLSTSGSEVASAVPNATAVTQASSAPAANPNQPAPPQASPNQNPANPSPANQSPANQATRSQAAPSQTISSQTAGNQPAASQPPQVPATQAAQTQPVESSAGPGKTVAPAQSTPAQEQSSASAAAAPASTPAKKEQAPAGSTPPSEQTATATETRNPASEPQTQSEAPESPDQDVEAEGEKYLYGSGVPADCTRAQKDLLEAGEHANPKAASVLGTMYATGHCVTRDLPLAYLWFSKAMREDPNNVRAENALLMVWSQMTPQEREVAVNHK